MPVTEVPVTTEFTVGQSCTEKLKVDDKMVHGYADLTGDHNPVHLDDAFAAKTPFGRRIAHGGILFGFISRILGTELPGVGTIFLSQTVNFKRPVFINDTVTLTATLVELLPKNGAKITTVVTNEKGEVVMDGFAEVKLPKVSK